MQTVQISKLRRDARPQAVPGSLAAVLVMEEALRLIPAIPMELCLIAGSHAEDALESVSEKKNAMALEIRSGVDGEEDEDAAGDAAFVPILMTDRGSGVCEFVGSRFVSSFFS